MEKHGIKQVAMLQCDIGGQLGEFMFALLTDDFVLRWWFAFEDAADQEKKIQALREDAEYRKVMQRVSEFAPDITVKTYRPISYSAAQ